jgi:RNA polymerase sigma-B factor
MSASTQKVVPSLNEAHASEVELTRVPLGTLRDRMDGLVGKRPGVATRARAPLAAEEILEERELFARLRDDADPIGREHVVERYLPLARALARRYAGSSHDFDDVFQVACLGLLKAADRFDLDRGTAFSSYAQPTISGEIKRYFRDRTWAVRVPRDLLELSLRVERATSTLERDLSRSPTVPELAQAVQASQEDVLEALQAAQAHRTTSLQARWGGADDPDEDTLSDHFGVEEDGYQLAEQRAILRDLTAPLTARERLVLHLRFTHDLTQAEIGERIGVTQMQVSRILRRTLARMQSAARGHARAA